MVHLYIHVCTSRGSVQIPVIGQGTHTTPNRNLCSKSPNSLDKFLLMLNLCDDLGVRTSATFLGEKVKNIHQTYDCACNRLCPLLGYTHSTQQIAVVPLFSWWKVDKNKELKTRTKKHPTLLLVRHWLGASVRAYVQLYLHADPAEMMLCFSNCKYSRKG